IGVRKTYDGIPFSGGDGVTYTGFVNGEDESVVDVSSLTYIGDAQGAVDVGYYTLVPSGLLADNYRINPIEGQLIIEKAAIVGIDRADAPFPFAGSEESLTITGTLPAGVSVRYTNNGRSEPGNQTVTATLDGGINYNNIILT